jgi:hypothetical protein
LCPAPDSPLPRYLSSEEVATLARKVYGSFDPHGEELQELWEEAQGHSGAVVSNIDASEDAQLSFPECEV